LPIGHSAIDTKWIFKVKEDGTKKARLVSTWIPSTVRGWRRIQLCSSL